MDIKSVLESIGYKLKPDNNGWRTNRIYAEGDNDTALKIYRSGWCQDFVEGETFDIKELIRKTLNLKDSKEVAQWLDSKQIHIVIASEKPELKMKKVYEKSALERLIPDHSYWNSRGISNEILERYRGGLSLSGGSKNRYVFPVFDNSNNLIGSAARDITNTKNNKWKLFGEKKNWVYPAFVNNKEISSCRSLILVESIGDMLALNEAGINNVIVLFGTEISWAIINYIIYYDANVVVSTNNDAQFRDNSAGNNAAQKIKDKITKYIDSHKVKIILPNLEKDFNEQLIKHGKDSIAKLFR